MVEKICETCEREYDTNECGQRQCNHKGYCTRSPFVHVAAEELDVKWYQVKDINTPVDCWEEGTCNEALLFRIKKLEEKAL
ncbi:MAG: hypothetical protein M0Q91_12635 [Methanoregula sp.]|jgi:hypothetical protein|nr:hypothetical protein [Methanoregula sp.]